MENILEKGRRKKNREHNSEKEAPAKKKKTKEPVLFDSKPPRKTKERHGVIWVPGAGFEHANYMGPGTDIFGRIARGDKGKTPIDQISKLHDIDYTLASGTAKTDAEQGDLGREADERMIRSGWKAYKEGKENLFNVVEGAGLIRAKTLLEDWGLLSRTHFLSPRSFKYVTGADKRDATEYEVLVRARHDLVCDAGSVNGDERECEKAEKELHRL